ncbi:hypothetical protein NM688_g534 [Phlebia brevispora]|uniref:Uncharacterized protein n=1 Tax=Phlebia brevispora TaxID=194682 RepID=A0ACC1TDR8_9APHY|nr:hypothetical protein NM688_g534 [Phlebia brevispora]
MATRRTLPHRGARPTYSSAQPPQAGSSRPRSVLTKSNASQRSGLSTPVEETFQQPPPPPSQPERVHSLRDDGETNIQVVLRCRRRSEREIQDNSPIIVSTSGARSTELTIQTTSASNSLGLVSLPAPRKYPFDVVFGPEADQSMIYQDVVSPMLDEIMKGYNCTLFAYGQTGTGKTYTMQGDLEPTPMGNPSADAGMIPRVLFRLFSRLEESVPDYSVKISFVELYNEELRDLLAPELAAPLGSIQPMGMGTGSKESSGLKIFDDSTKKGGVFIQGLDERPVKSAEDALKLLKKGSERRQIAATKFNDHSSRSHSVFSVTVLTKEKSSVKGDDLLKVGKLNLVDLAGSENIGRSGAENKRAREAGMINQSLLTLGRVINALVDRSPHVPYRESKLTRLLQDSLGGRTKTCIIATISPARSNMEETLSTLDYALRAKSIRNRPEVNQRMSRNALIKEYVAELERLQADLCAAYEKDGVYFSQTTWKQMAAEQELKDTALQEAQKNVEILKSQLAHLQEEFSQSVMLLDKSNTELKETKERLQSKEATLELTESQLKVTNQALEEEIVVRKAFQENESALDGVATGLKDVAQQSVQDLGRLFGKLERKTTVFTSNVQAVSAHTRKISTEAREFTSKLDDFVKVSNQHVINIRTEGEQYRTKELEALAGFSARLDQQLEKLQESLKLVQAKDAVVDEAMESVKTTVEETQEGIKSSFGNWAETLQRHCENSCKEAEKSTAASCAMVEKAFKSLSAITETILAEAQDYIESERKSLQETKALADSTSKAEILRLQQQNALLTRLLESERAKAERAQQDLLNRISGLLGSFVAERDRSLREAFSEMTDSNTAAEAGMVRLGKDQGERLDAVVDKGREWSSTLTKKGGELKRTRDGAFKTIGNASSTMRENLSKVQGVLSTSIPIFASDINRRIQASNAAYAEANEGMSRAKRARIEATDTMVADSQSGYRYMQRGISTTSRNAELMTGQILSETSGLSRVIDNHNRAAAAHLSEIYQTTQALADQGTREDMPTGMTPRRRAWEITDQWTLTKSRDTILKEWKQISNSASSSSSSSISSRSEGSMFEHAPVPEEDESEAESVAAMTDGEASEALSQADEHDETIRVASPPVAKPRAASSSSTTSSLSSQPPPIPEPKKPTTSLRSGLPTRGTLTERPTNILARASRRLRR